MDGPISSLPATGVEAATVARFGLALYGLGMIAVFLSRRKKWSNK